MPAKRHKSVLEAKDAGRRHWCECLPEFGMPSVVSDVARAEEMIRVAEVELENARQLLREALAELDRRVATYWTAEEVAEAKKDFSELPPEGRRR